MKFFQKPSVSLNGPDCSIGPLPRCRPGAFLASIPGILFASLLHFLFPGSSYLSISYRTEVSMCGWVVWVEIYSNTTLKKGEQEIFVFERNSVSLKISLFSPYIWLIVWVQNSRLEILFCSVIWRHCSALCELLLLMLRGPTMPRFPYLWMWAIFSRIFILDFWNFTIICIRIDLLLFTVLGTWVRLFCSSSVENLYSSFGITSPLAFCVSPFLELLLFR